MADVELKLCSCGTGLRADHGYLDAQGAVTFLRCARCARATTKPERWQTPEGRLLSDVMHGWKKARDRDEVYLSSSQIEAHALCPRLRWFQSVRKVPGKAMSPGKLLGDVGHKAIERWQSADEQGLGADGQPVEPFPDGWRVVRNKFRPDEVEGEAPDAGATQVRRLVTDAIEQGALVRRPGRLSEYAFELDLGEIEYRPGKKKRVIIRGSIDLLVPDPVLVEDYKFRKSAKYLKGKKLLAQDIQLKIYSLAALFLRQELGLPMPEVVRTQHVGFVLDPKAPMVKTCAVDFSVQELGVWHSSWLLPTIVEILRVQDQDQWEQVDVTCRKRDACQAFGGCAYDPVCSGQQTLEGLLNTRAVLHARRQQEEEGMGSFGDRLAGLIKSSGGAVQAPQAPKVPPVTPATPQAAPVQPKTMQTAAPAQPQVSGAVELFGGTGAPPWANPACLACKNTPHPGFLATMQPCRVCAATAKSRGVPHPNEFHIDHSTPGRVSWTKDGVEGCYEDPRLPGGKPAVVKTPGVVAEKIKTVSTKKSVALQPQEIKPTGMGVGISKPPAEEPKAAEGVVAWKMTKIEQTTGLVLCIGCSPIGLDPQEVVSVADRLPGMLEEASKAAGKSHWLELDAFKRADAIRAMAPTFAAKLKDDGVQYVIGSLFSIETRTLTEALEAEAAFLIRGHGA